ncbi:ABC transporter ATP-binding protein [Roseiarcaceae bacterium H3SJ34-1]|uniref:ABC transporter ATP-binding protein n=1 Tax=Terripilifer ovatus TaxID=3032367 RepID=UPI003AB9ACD2|nr:ABC transporter ATP-binding protein [Roseiarcaceae bacterium H3SJ34-1]
MAGVGIEAISKSYGGIPVLRGVSLDVRDGEFLTLLGPSGCGKSTLLRIIAGLEIQDGGEIAIGGRPVDGARPKRRDVAMVFQSYALYPHMTVAANMALPLRMRRLSRWQRLPLIGPLLPGARAATARIEEEVRRTAAALEIGHVLERRPGQLSGGQRQRVAVGRAMVRQPAVFLMDEPLSNLDAKLRVTMRAEIKELHRRLGTTFIYVTHDQAEAMTLSDRVAVMLGGELLQVAAPQEIYADPADRRVAEFIGSPRINLIPAKVRDAGAVEIAGERIAVATGLPAGSQVTLGIRPEALFPAMPDERGFHGHVRLVEHLGSDLYVHLDAAGMAEPLIARLRAERAPDLAIGMPLRLTARTGHILLFDADGRRLRSNASAGSSDIPALGPELFAEPVP